MARKPRVHFAGAFYNVIARGNKGAKVFKTHQDYKLYLRFLKDYKERYPFFLYAYVLMPPHVHFLMEVQETPLSKIMQSLQFRYTRHYNLKYRTWGHLFQGRVKDILCEKDLYFLELSAYLHLNPVRPDWKKILWIIPGVVTRLTSLAPQMICWINDPSWLNFPRFLSGLEKNLYIL
jgi:putative transposase